MSELELIEAFSNNSCSPFEVLVNLVGQQAALAGTAKVFDTLQNQTLNKQGRKWKNEFLKFPYFDDISYFQTSAVLRSPRNRRLRRLSRAGGKQRRYEVQEMYSQGVLMYAR